MRETLDEAIDRVASTLTAVSVDPGFVDRLEARLDRRRSQVPMWLMLATATTVVAAIVLVDRPRESERAAIEATLPRVADASPALPSAAVDLPADVSGSAGRSESRHELVTPDMPPPPIIAALTGPPSLAVDELSLESLDIAPVEIVHLDDVPSLELPALETTRPGEFR